VLVLHAIVPKQMLHPEGVMSFRYTNSHHFKKDHY
jgi:hypothetical protein